MTKTRPSKSGDSESRAGGRFRWIVILCAVVVLGITYVLMIRGGASETAGKSLATVKAGDAAGFNVLLVTLDTTRADRLGCYGHDSAETPSLDALARAGILFSKTITTVPMTLPAHCSIHTGLYPPNHEVRDNGEYVLADKYTTLAEVLKEAGYETVGFVSAFVLDGRFGLKQGFDVYNDSVDAKQDMPVGQVVNERSAAAVTDAAVAWLANRADNSPFFAWVHYFDPHQPYDAPAPFKTRLAESPYDAEIAYMDSQVGRLLGELEKTGQRDNTLVFVVGDHGESLGEHAEQTHGTFIYDAVMRVPLILSCPSLFQGGYVVDDAVVSVVDIFPTVLHLLGISVGPTVDGENLLGATEQEDRVVYLESMTSFLDYGWSPLFGLRSRSAKYIKAPRPEFYDLHTDRGELDNLFTKVSPGVAKRRDRLVSELEAMLAKWPSPEQAAGAAVALDAEGLARLESLGYVGGASRDTNAIQLDPKDMTVLMDKINMARSLVNFERFEEALTVLLEVKEASPGSADVEMHAARVYLALGREREAEEALRKVIAIKPQAHAFVLLAQILLADRNYDDADVLLRQAVKMDPHNGAAFIAHGDLAAAQGRMREARDSYLRAQEVDPYQSEQTAEYRLGVLRQHMEGVRRQQGAEGG